MDDIWLPRGQVWLGLHGRLVCGPVRLGVAAHADVPAELRGIKKERCHAGSMDFMGKPDIAPAPAGALAGVVSRLAAPYIGITAHGGHTRAE
jgi:hypothetical protein